jgi:cyclophilin family peptidyl-prolyl cis-trans isomerase
VLFRSLILSLALAVMATGFIGCGASDDDEVAVLETSYGRIVYEFLPEYAPKHTAAFRQMVKDGFFDGTKFHRIIRNKIIQGGDPNSKDDDPSDDGLGQPGQPTIPAEFSTEIKHKRGIVSAARKGDNKDSATSQFFIVLDDEPNYDGQYSIFGRVIDGMNVVQLIASAPTSSDPKYRERPADPVTITHAYLSTRKALGLPPKSAEPKLESNTNGIPVVPNKK